MPKLKPADKVSRIDGVSGVCKMHDEAEDEALSIVSERCLVNRGVRGEDELSESGATDEVC